MRQQKEKKIGPSTGTERERNIVIMAVWITQDSRIVFTFTSWPAAPDIASVNRELR